MGERLCRPRGSGQEVRKIVDPRDRPTVTDSSDHFTRVARPSVRPSFLPYILTFENLTKQNHCEVSDSYWWDCGT